MRIAGKIAPHLPAPNELFTITVKFKSGETRVYKDQWEDAANRMKGILDNRKRSGDVVSYTVTKQS